MSTALAPLAKNQISDKHVSPQRIAFVSLLRKYQRNMLLQHGISGSTWILVLVGCIRVQLVQAHQNMYVFQSLTLNVHAHLSSNAKSPAYIYFHNLYVRAAKALARLRMCMHSLARAFTDRTCNTYRFHQ